MENNEKSSGVTYSVTIYGFWTELQRTVVPMGKEIYFVFAGNIIGENACRILRTLFVGEKTSSVAEKIASGDLADYRELLNEGESLFFATGDVVGDARLVKNALIEKIKPMIGDKLDVDFEQANVFTLHIDGKIPGIYRGYGDFKAPASKVEVQ